LRYLRGIVGYGHRYASSVDMRLQGHADADWVGSVVDRKSTSGCCFTLGSAMVSWCSRKQTSVALSTVEAEYIALCVEVRVADVFTKPLARTKFKYFHKRLGLVENASLAERECS
jgi:hypothetical protein